MTAATRDTQEKIDQDVTEYKLPLIYVCVIFFCLYAYTQTHDLSAIVCSAAGDI